MADSSAANDLLADALLRDVPVIEGHKVLAGICLYAKVGQGGMGVVYRGRHCLLDLDLAVKVLKPSLVAEDPRFALRFLREAQVAARITHPNMVRLYDGKQEHGLHFLSMEFVDGETARARVERKGPLAEAEALGILLGAAHGLGEAHRAQLVHRDVKPDNVLIARDGRVKVADLGLVKREPGGDASLTLGSAIMGTPQFMAPEQWESPDVTAAADVWALGATLYFLLVGRAAFEVTTLAMHARRMLEQEFPSLREARPDLREEVYTLFARCVARRPEQRFAEARELAAALQLLAPAGEAALADAAAGQAGSRPSWPTPPPRATLERIRDVLGTTVPATPSGVRSEAATLLSPGGTLRLPPPGGGRRPRWLAAVLGLLALAGGIGWYGYEAGWFDDAEWEATERLARARTLWSRAQGEVREAASLDAGIATLEEVVGLQPDFGEARLLLAEALDRRAGRVLATDPDAAYVAASRAVELHPGQATFAGRLEQARTEVLARLRRGLELVEPKVGAVVEGQRLRLHGRVAPGAVAVRVTGHRLGEAPPSPRRVVVIGGEFECELPVGGPGPCMVGVGVEDRHGLVAGAMPRRLFTTGAIGAPDWVGDPRANPQPVIHNTAGITMRPIPVRTFLMGASRVDSDAKADEAQHEVTLSEPFWLGETEVTRAQWMRLMATSPWLERVDENPGDEPALRITYAMAAAFGAELTKREGAAGRLPAGYCYCLPTEAQWELAAHGGEYQPYVHGNLVSRLEEYAVFGEPARFPATVASKQANAFGLFDLAGNVDEWCEDLAIAKDGMLTTLTYQDGVAEPLGNVGPLRVHRGGNFGSPARDCRNTARFAAPPDTSRDSLGFRIALARR